ncbi:enoyl-CoA hydratase/isomerase family protein [Nonomuraea endophytica]|uniref:enoyl-CoA hydratase n=1 Tax=Nonomuraea endophytica TaxID=714136 RepID=A0A7W8EH83_9ACTN|nr:enoyl-CoA hydratase-related protein [Nonomuraea endophytica]MBB5079196.1 enoyl-CoA hydratase/carnithine racemase [Nonomuraea endophytica]
MATLVNVTHGACAEIELDNPPVNVVSRELTGQLRAALRAVGDDEDTRVVILHGAGTRAFCAGSDIAEFDELHEHVAERKLLLEKLVYRQLAKLRVPSIAAVEGYALGGGLELALCCDLRIAGDQARLGLPELKLGVLPGSGGTQRLPRIVGPARAKEIILLGEPLDAATALSIGLVNRVVRAGTALAAAREMAATIAARGPLAVQAAKSLIDQAAERPLDDGLALELDESEKIFSTQDAREGARAFLAKRPPAFRKS